MVSDPMGGYTCVKEPLPKLKFPTGREPGDAGLRYPSTNNRRATNGREPLRCEEDGTSVDKAGRLKLKKRHLIERIGEGRGCRIRERGEGKQEL